MSSSETVLGRFVRRVESQYPLAEFSRKAWPAFLSPGANKFAAAFDGSALAAVFESSPTWTSLFIRAVQHPELGAVRLRELSATSLAKVDRQVLVGLVYGFGLPDLLFSELSAVETQRYWQRTLIRSVAVHLASQRWNRADAEGLFAAAMVADVGSLVLLRELKQTYVQFIADAEKHGHDLYQMELESLGFDQRVLAARLLDRWSIADAVTRMVGDAMDGDGEVASFAQAEHLTADDRRRYVFQAGDLLGELYGGRLSAKRAEQQRVRLTRMARQVFGWELADLKCWADEAVESAQFLASCFGVEIGEPQSPTSSFDEAWNAEVQRELMIAKDALGAESASSQVVADSAALGASVGPKEPSAAPLVKSVATSVGPTSKSVDGLGNSQDWSGGLFFGVSESTGRSAAGRKESAQGSTLAVANEPLSAWISDHLLLGQVQNLIEVCRSRRQSLSLTLAQIDHFESLLFGGSMDEVYRIQQSLLTGFEQLASGEGGRVVELGDDKFGFLLPGLDRTAANRFGQEILRAMRQWSSNRHQIGKTGLTISLGCASTDVPARNLKAAALIEAAARCLDNVQRSAGNGLKSIDIYY
ncbi:MAG: HDOD domain-containing protein [Pirellulaceae bacterium]|nr:HDOD domain-containing protein [Pirellulaceae bacterium]